jgi:hypothetical protein
LSTLSIKPSASIKLPEVETIIEGLTLFDIWLSIASPLLGTKNKNPGVSGGTGIDADKSLEAIIRELPSGVEISSGVKMCVPLAELIFIVSVPDIVKSVLVIEKGTPNCSFLILTVISLSSINSI